MDTIFSFDDVRKMKKITVMVEDVVDGVVDSTNKVGLGLIIRGQSENDDTTRLRMIFNSVLDTLFDGKYRCSIQTVGEKEENAPATA